MSLALLPTRTYVNPVQADGHEYHCLGSDVLYVFEGTRDGRSGHLAASSCGLLGDDLAIGTGHVVRHDQTGRIIGHFRVIGIVDEHGAITGVAPTRAVAHYVFK